MGSNPTGTIGPVAQWIARKTSNLKVAGSSPARVAFCRAHSWLISLGFDPFVVVGD